MTSELALFDADQPTDCGHCGRQLVEQVCAWCSTRSGADAARAAIAAANNARDLEWAHRADAWLDDMTDAGTVITADDLIDAVGLPLGSSNQIGARFQIWRKAGYIRAAGVDTSRRPSSHGRLLWAWEVVA